jgi:ABC-type microcin C transport system duplicated ATPase subunit YejF
MLFVTHDLAITRKIADSVYVMESGENQENNNLIECNELGY